MTRRFGWPVYTSAEIDSWTRSSPGYTGLAATGSANTSYTVVDFGTSHTQASLRGTMLGQSQRCKIQAGLWAADGNAARKSKAVELLDAVKDITRIDTDADPSKDALEASWWVPNYVQGAAIVGYTNANFANLLRNVVYPTQDWTTAPNWHATFASARLQIAAYLKDPVLWDDAVAYFHYHVPRMIYHAAYDKGFVVPLRSGSWPSKQTASIHSGLTNNHWGNGWNSAPQVAVVASTNVQPYRATYDATYGPSHSMAMPFPNGTDGERRRDISHQSMTLAGLVQAARTIKAQNVTLNVEMHDRIRAFASYHGHRVLSYLQSGVIPEPKPIEGSGGTGCVRAWYGTRALFRSSTPSSVTALLARPEVSGASAAGALHLTAELFMDRNPYG